MEVGANRKSLVQLGIAVAVLVAVVYFQFLRDPGPPRAQREAELRPVEAPEPGRQETLLRPAEPTRRTGGRFRPRLGRSSDEHVPDPMTAATTLRTDLLDRVRGIEEPALDRDIFNFGQPRPVAVKPPTADETERAQQRLEAAMRKRPPRPQPAPKEKAPNWKYYGLASLPGQDTRRGFLLDGEEILVAAEGALVGEHYRIGEIGQEALVLVDVRHGQEFRIRLEAAQ